MEMSGRKLIPEPRETVWKALNDPEILRNCVPGCQTLEKTSDTEMVATATLRVGPVSAKFGGKISLSELNAPVSYRITGEGQGGVAGFAKGTAVITLDEVADGTMLIYTVEAQVGGKLAQLGGRLIDATARKMSEAFFESFANEIRRQYHGEAAIADAPAPIGGESDAARPPVPTGGHPPVPNHSAPPQGSPGRQAVVTLSALALAATFAFLWLTGRQGGAPALAPQALLSPELGAAVQLILIAAVGYLFGRLSDRRG